MRREVVMPWHSCAVVCGCVVTRVPVCWRPWRAGVGFAGELGVRGCPWHGVGSLRALLPAG